MAKIKKESLSDLKEELVEKSDEVAVALETKAEKAAEDVIEAVEKVKKKGFFKKVLKNIPTGRFAMLTLGFLALAGIGASGYFYYQYANTQAILGSTQNQYSEVKEIVESVGKLMDLPTEEPTVATVSDVEMLRDQPFFNRAQNGDKVLIYQTTRKAILYRPSTNKIIDVATVNLDDPATTATSEDKANLTPTPEVISEGPVRITIWNGTNTTGLTLRGESALSKIEYVEVVERDNATKKDYDNSIVVNIGNVSGKRVSEIAEVLGANVEKLPDNENKPANTDILVILGRDFIDGSTPSE